MRRGHDHHPLPADLAEVAEQLRAERPELDPLELDHVKVLARRRAGSAARTSRKKGTFMRSRIAITAILALGILMSGAGATLAVSSLTGSAATHQYGHQDQGGQQGGQSLGGVGGANEGSGGQPLSGVAGQEEGSGAGGTGGSGDVQAARQASGERSLPFTGFAAIPVLLSGLALLVAGFVLRRRVSDT